MLPGKKSNYYLIVAQVGPGDLKRLPLAALSVPAGNRFSGIDSHGESSKPFGHFEGFFASDPFIDQVSAPRGHWSNSKWSFRLASDAVRPTRALEQVCLYCLGLQLISNFSTKRHLV